MAFFMPEVKKSIMNNPTSSVNDEVFDLSKIKSCFIASVGQTLSNLGAEDGLMVRRELLTIIGGQTVPYMFSPDFIQELRDKVFENETFRDWLLNARFVFFMNLAAQYGREMVSFVVDNLARSASLDLGAEEFLDADQINLVDKVNEVPPQVQQELMPYRAVKTALAANTWMVVIMMAIAFINLEHEVLQMPGTKQ